MTAVEVGASKHSQKQLPVRYSHQFPPTFLGPEHLLSNMQENVARQIHKLLSHCPAKSHHQVSATRSSAIAVIADRTACSSTIG